VGSTVKLAISNIAWPSEQDTRVAELMSELGLRGVEIAPTVVWKKPLEATEGEIRDYRRFWNDRGIEIVALQALLYGRPDLTLFESREVRDRTLQYLRGIMRLGGRLGARALVFGSPKNRKIGGLPANEVEETAVSFFRTAGEAAVEEGVILCIEPNPSHYQCDFITTSAQALELVRKVDSAGFGLHLDTAAMTLSEEPPELALAACAGSVCHFHASEPFLGPVGLGAVDHETFASALRQNEYPNWVSVEMKQPEVETMTELGRVLRYLIRTYGG
jgi:sugar phosphate isomerase/epimerase